jgi:hypothetical protein
MPETGSEGNYDPIVAQKVAVGKFGGLLFLYVPLGP